MIDERAMKPFYLALYAVIIGVADSKSEAFELLGITQTIGKIRRPKPKRKREKV